MKAKNGAFESLNRARIIAVVALVLGALFDYLFYAKAPGINFPLYVFLLTAGLWLMARLFKKPIDRHIFWLLFPLLFFSAMVFVRASLLLTFLNIVASLLLLLILAEVFSGKKLRNFLIKDYFKIFFLPFKFISPLFQTLVDFFQPAAKNKGKALRQVLKGIFLAVPFLVVFLLLFSSADLVFHKYVAGLIIFDINPEIIFRLFLVLALTLFYIGAYRYALGEKENQVIAKPRTCRLEKLESAVLLGLINLLFFVFILFQLTYLFGGKANISLQGFTYAEYARRGFFELIAVAAISLLLLLGVEKYVVKKETAHFREFKILGTALVIQVGLIMASALRRLSLYEQAYGFTVLRLYSHVFIIFLAVVFGFLLYKIHKNQEEKNFAYHVFLSLIFFLAVTNFLNPEAFVARRNLERFYQTGDLDVFYLSNLSSDALPQTIKILDIADEKLRKDFACQLYERVQEKNSSSFSSWQAFNLSRARADKIINFSKKDFEGECQDYLRFEK